ncbi:MAG TPA: hypothetical protein PKC40_07100 [Saprospiraceae bacterium]|nr:hypothetical protein [Saprospiraceae bacterium]
MQLAADSQKQTKKNTFCQDFFALQPNLLKLSAVNDEDIEIIIFVIL